MKCEKVGENKWECEAIVVPDPNQAIKGTVQGQISCALSCFNKFDYNWKEDICTCKSKQVVPWWFK